MIKEIKEFVAKLEKREEAVKEKEAALERFSRELSARNNALVVLESQYSVTPDEAKSIKALAEEERMFNSMREKEIAQQKKEVETSQEELERVKAGLDVERENIEARKKDLEIISRDLENREKALNEEKVAYKERIKKEILGAI